MRRVSWAMSQMRVEETGAGVSFSGAWTRADASWGWSGGSAMQSTAAGATASITFTGAALDADADVDPDKPIQDELLRARVFDRKGGADRLRPEHYNILIGAVLFWGFMVNAAVITLMPAPIHYYVHPLLCIVSDQSLIEFALVRLAGYDANFPRFAPCPGLASDIQPQA